MSRESDPISDDSIFHGSLRLRQHRGGYRFTEDSLILAAFAARPEMVEIAVDFGAGCGVVGLALLSQGAARRVLALELQDDLARLIQYNSAQNSLDRQFSVLKADFRFSPLRNLSVDLIVSNPPYLKLGRGRVPENRERALARHELACSPLALCQSALSCLSSKGRLVVVYPTDRFDDLLDALRVTALQPKRLRMVHPAENMPPSLFLMEAVPGRINDLYDTEPALYAHELDGSRGREMERILAGNWFES